MIQELPLSRYTPSMLPHATLEAIYVRRDDIVERITERVRASALGGDKHYALLIGPRGIGKTHIVSLVYHRTKADDALKDRLAIAWLREEEWGIASYLDFLRSVLRAIAEEYDDRAFAARCDAIVKKTLAEAEAEAESLLLEWVNSRTLLILAENMDEIFRALEETGQEKLRALIQNHPIFTLLFTSQSLFNGVASRKSPFYGFFDIHHLAEFTFEHAVAVLTNLAQHAGATELAEYLQSTEGRARLRAVHHLAGGNPRIYMIFSQFLTKASLDELAGPVMKTLDDLTPYYQARMSYLTPQQRKIVEFLCERRGAVPVSEIASSNFMTHQTASGQLKRLREWGYVRSHEHGRDAFYELHEPLMRIALEVKRLRGEPIRLIVEFLRLWYSRNELACRLAALAPERPETPLEREYLERALSTIEKETDDPRVIACIEDYRKYYKSGDFEGALRVAEELVCIRGFTSDWLRQTSVLEKLDQEGEAKRIREEAFAQEPKNIEAWEDRIEELAHLERHSEVLSQSGKISEKNKDNLRINYHLVMALLKKYPRKDTLNNLKRLFPPRQSKVSWIVFGSLCTSLGEYEEGLIAYDKALEYGRFEDNSLEASLWIERAKVLNNLCQYKEALLSCKEALKYNPEDASAWTQRGYALAYLGKYEQAVSAFDNALKYAPEDAAIWHAKGRAMIGCERKEEALASFDIALEYQAENSYLWRDRAFTLIYLREDKEALDSIDRALQENANDAVAHCLRAVILVILGQDEEALASAERAKNLDPDFAVAWRTHALILCHIGRTSEALSSLDKAIELVPAEASFHCNRAIVLSALGLYEDALAAFDKAVELDTSIANFDFLSNRADVLLALGRMEEGTAALDRALESLVAAEGEETRGDYDLVRSLLLRTQEESAWRRHIAVWMDAFSKKGLLGALGTGLVRSIRMLKICWITHETAEKWLQVWRELAEGYKEMALPLRLLETAVEYLNKPDERVLLRLPVEERKIIEPLVKPWNLLENGRIDP